MGAKLTSEGLAGPNPLDCFNASIFMLYSRLSRAVFERL